MVGSAVANEDRAGPRAGPAVWTGRILSGLVTIFLLLDGGIKLVPIRQVVEVAAQLGWPTDPDLWRTLGAILIVVTVLYAYPPTATLGAILITAYLGGAVATHVRIGNPLFSHTLFGVYLGVLTWGGLWLRDPRLRALLR